MVDVEGAAARERPPEHDAKPGRLCLQPTGDRGFESCSLQRRVHCEPDFLDQGAENNDCDETLPAPFEWDLKRLAASLVTAGRVAAMSERDNRRRARGFTISVRPRRPPAPAA